MADNVTRTAFPVTEPAVDDDPQTEGVASALADLVNSPGWRLFTTHLATEYGPAGYGRQASQALASISAGPDRPYEVQAAMDRIHHTAEAVNKLVKWPEEQIARLTKQTPERVYEKFRRTMGVR